MLGVPRDANEDALKRAYRKVNAHCDFVLTRSGARKSMSAMHVSCASGGRWISAGADVASCKTGLNAKQRCCLAARFTHAVPDALKLFTWLLPGATSWPLKCMPESVASCLSQLQFAAAHAHCSSSRSLPSNITRTKPRGTKPLPRRSSKRSHKPTPRSAVSGLDMLCSVRRCRLCGLLWSTESTTEASPGTRSFCEVASCLFAGCRALPTGPLMLTASCCLTLHAFMPSADPEKRKIYDAYGEEGLKQGAPPPVSSAACWPSMQPHLPTDCMCPPRPVSNTGVSAPASDRFKAFHSPCSTCCPDDGRVHSMHWSELHAAWRFACRALVAVLACSPEAVEPPQWTQAGHIQHHHPAPEALQTATLACFVCLLAPTGAAVPLVGY